jgi:hypothetical protein
MPQARPDLCLHVGAGDGNRVRTISLGICRITQVIGPHQSIVLSASDRDWSLFAGANGTLIARPTAAYAWLGLNIR